MFNRVTHWLETRWITPAYSGWLLMAIAIFFFGAATNTLAGWLYVMSGVMLALLAIAATLPPRNLQGLKISRQPIRPVSAGDALLIDLTIENTTPRAKALIQVHDHLPPTLGKIQTQAIAAIRPNAIHHWRYEIPTQRRGIYHWKQVQLRTAAPLGLFWSSRYQAAIAKAVVYPTILPLTNCPLLDLMGKDDSYLWHQDQRAQSATEGLTRALRPYRWGDPTRLIHWRTSARYGELRVRELENHTSGQTLTLGLDTTISWTNQAFEQAVIALASLYVYALRVSIPTQIWTARTGLLSEKIAILTTLAAIHPSDSGTHGIPNHALIWLTQGDSNTRLPKGSRLIQWSTRTLSPETQPYPSLTIAADAPLQKQLQRGI
ncbi:MAG: DUF58 domain-containing protein [Cyanobacteria bacterium J06639_16]